VLQRLDHTKPIFKPAIDLSGNVHYDSKLQYNITLNKIRDYPNEFNLYKAISEYYQTPIKNIAIGHGATEVIERLVKLYSNRKFYIVSPTFEMVRVYCEIYNVKYQLIDSDYIWNINDPNGVLYIATPNGQTGEYVNPAIFKRLVFHTVIADLVYHEFSPKPNPFLYDSNIIAIYSISKTLGLAGLRVGWAVANEETINRLQEIRSNYITNSAACCIVPEIISDTKNIVNRMLETKQYLHNKYDCNHSYGNFVLFKQPNELTEKYGFRLTKGGYRMALMDMDTCLEINYDT